MDFSIIDEMFDAYKNEDLKYAEDIFIKTYKNYEKYGKGHLINIVKEYIQQQSNNVPNHFVSNKDNVRAEHNLITDFVTAFENLVTPVQYEIIDLTNTPFEDYASNVCIKPHDLFNININLIENAVKNNDDCYLDDYNKIKELLIYVKKHKVLKTLFKDESWYELDFEELMYNIYDFVKNKEIFKIDSLPSYRIESFVFEKIKTNCAEMLGSNFDKFRPNLNSTKQIRADFGKLIFCRNLLMFYETGIMPSYDGFIDFSVDYLEHLNLIDDFKRLYRTNFNEELFRKNQQNFICNPNIFCHEYKLETGKKVMQGDKLIVGYIISCLDSQGSIQNDLLIHIEIDDVKNSSSNYEMQINVIPQGNLDYRLQLMRLDNWESKQPHKNIAKKLTTTTHIHLYNEFDLLRGKTNGAFDIAYNLEGTGVKFEHSLKKFLDILDMGEEISNRIYKSTIKCLNLEAKSELQK